MLSNAWTHRLFLLATLLVAFWLRVHRLEQFPAGLHFDEAANAILSSEIAFDGYRPIFISSYTGKETLFFYTAAGVMNRMGASIFSLRLTAALFGTLTIAVTYQLGMAVFRDRRIALIAAVLLTANFSHLLFSRLGFRAISQPLLQALTILFLIYGFQRLNQKRPAWHTFTAAGLFLGLTAHTYLAARLFPIALALPLLLYIIYPLIWRQKTLDLPKTILSLVQTGAIALLVLAPLLYWFALHPEAFWVRIGQVGGTNDSITVVEGLRRAALMLFWKGDPYIRFNLPGRPLFFPLMIVPAVIGIWQLISKLNTAPDGANFGRLSVLIVPFVMLLPTALATNEIVPSNLRAIGIFPFIVFWPAIGLVYMVDKAYKWIRSDAELSIPVSLKGAFIPLFLLLLGSSAINVYQSYFTNWGNRQDSFYETEGDLRETAIYLNQLDTDRPVVVATRFVPHPSLAFLANDYDRFILIPEGRTVVYPQGELPFYLFPASSPENSLTLRLDGERKQFFSKDKFPTFTTLTLKQPMPEPQSAVFSNFGFATKLTGYDLDVGKVGGSLFLTTYHEVLGNPGFNMVPFVHLEDHLGNRWSQVEQPGYSAADWHEGDQFMQQFELPLPAGMPPTSSYILRIGWFDETTGEEVTRFNADNQFAGSAFLIESVAISPSDKLSVPVLKTSAELDTKVTDGLTLSGLNMSRHLFSQGDRLDYELHWLAETAQNNIKLVTQIVQEDTVIELESVDPAGDSYPFSAWQTPAFIIDHHRMQLPADLSPGEWQLQTLARFDDQSSLPLFEPVTIMVEALDLIFDLPAPDQLVKVSFNDEIELIGFSLDEESGLLEIIWQAKDQSAGDYVAFVQLLNDDQTCCTWQADRPLVSSAARPTSRWVNDEMVLDQYQIENYEAGQPLIVGLYRPENGIRLLTSQQADFVRLR